MVMMTAAQKQIVLIIDIHRGGCHLEIPREAPSIQGAGGRGAIKGMCMRGCKDEGFGLKLVCICRTCLTARSLALPACRRVGSCASWPAGHISHQQRCNSSQRSHQEAGSLQAANTGREQQVHMSWLCCRLAGRMCWAYHMCRPAKQNDSPAEGVCLLASLALLAIRLRPPSRAHVVRTQVPTCAALALLGTGVAGGAVAAGVEVAVAEGVAPAAAAGSS